MPKFKEKKLKFLEVSLGQQRRGSGEDVIVDVETTKIIFGFVKYKSVLLKTSKTFHRSRPTAIHQTEEEVVRLPNLLPKTLPLVSLVPLLRTRCVDHVKKKGENSDVGRLGEE